MTQASPCPKPSAKREVILDAARVVFLEVGYAAASMDSVAARAGVSKATSYAHFSSKDQLFAAMIRRRCDRNSTFAPVDPALDARATLSVVGQRVLDLLLLPDTLAMFRVVVAESARQPDLAQAFYASGPGAGRAEIAQVIADLTARGAIRADDPARLADLFIGMLRTDLFMRTLLGLAQPTEAERAEAVAAAVDTLLAACGVPNAATP